MSRTKLAAAAGLAVMFVGACMVAHWGMHLTGNFWLSGGSLVITVLLLFLAAGLIFSLVNVVLHTIVGCIKVLFGGSFWG